MGKRITQTRRTRKRREQIEKDNTHNEKQRQ